MNIIDYLDWSYVCDQCPEIRQKHEDVSDGYEYGLNFHEFIETQEGLGSMANKWWKTLPIEDKKRMIEQRRKELQDTLDGLNEAAKKEGL